MGILQKYLNSVLNSSLKGSLLILAVSSSVNLDAGPRRHRSDRFMKGEQKQMANNELRRSSWLETGKAQYKQNNTDLAIVALKNQLNDNERDAEAWFYLGLAYDKCQDYDLAFKAFRQANHLEANSQYYYYGALSLYKGGEVRNAIKHLRILLSKEAKYGPAWKGLGLCYESLEQYAYARAAYKKAKELMPFDGELIYYISNLPAEVQEETDMELPPLSGYEKYENSIKARPMQAGSLPISEVLKYKITKSRDNLGKLGKLEESYNLSTDAPAMKPMKASPVHHWPKQSNWEDQSDYEKSMIQSPPIPLEDL
ncbi:MAG: tetratricopeptide repeat protein [Planctomycetes bacterium]|nr:tetratricopeptide repeat protein [Planctomycetota bacterium]